jgi:very-short-patch-repair endonuclease
MSHLVESLLKKMDNANLPKPRTEYHFTRRVVGDGPGIRERLKQANLKDWRFDLAYPSRRIAVEVEGATWTNGRHTRGSGFTEDCRKYNTAAIFGWKVLRVTSDMIRDGSAVETIQRALHY